MLYNSNGQRVKLDKKFNSKENPNLMKQFKEILEPADKYHGTMFQLGERAIFDQVGQRAF